MIKVTNLNFGYFDTEVFKGFSIEVEEGENLALLGPNGSGKTTLIKILSKILAPKSGNVLIENRDINSYSYAELSRVVASVPQIHRPTFQYTVFDVVLAGRNPHLTSIAPSKQDEEIVLSILEELNISKLADRPYTDISGGELRLVLIARALAQEAKIILLDESKSDISCNFKNKNLILNKVLELREKKNITFIITLHDPNEAFQVADRVLLLKKGEVVALGKTDDVLTPENLKYVYDIDVEKVTYDGKVFIFAK